MVILLFAKNANQRKTQKGTTQTRGEAFILKIMQRRKKLEENITNKTKKNITPVKQIEGRRSLKLHRYGIATLTLLFCLRRILCAS